MSDKVEADRNDDENEVYIVDPEDYARTQKIKDIFSAKREYQKSLRKADAERKTELENLRLFVSELYPIMEQKDTEIDYTTYTLHEIEVCNQDFSMNVKKLVSGDRGFAQTVPESKVREALRQEGILEDYPIDLSDIRNTGGYAGLEITAGVACAKGKALPERVSNKAFNLCIDFMDEAGLGIELEEEVGPAEL